jgi:type II secretory pathway component GspD/PulD (secretin)
VARAPITVVSIALPSWVDVLERWTERQPLVYVPKFREVSYLMNMVRNMVPGASAAFGAVGAAAGGSSDSGPASLPGGQTIDPASALGQVQQQAEALVIYAPPEDLERVRDILPLIDTAPGEVLVEATVFEVSTSRKSGSAVALAAQILSKGVGITANYSPAQIGGGSLVIQGSQYSAALNLLGTSGLFRVVTSPSVRAKSGSQASFKSGDSVPLLGSLSYSQGSSTPIQSVTYADSGVTFTVTPVSFLVTAPRMRACACVTASRLCVRTVLCSSAFLLVPSSPSTNSAVDRSALFAGFAGTIDESDFFVRFIIGYGLRPSR